MPTNSDAEAPKADPVTDKPAAKPVIGADELKAENQPGQPDGKEATAKADTSQPTPAKKTKKPSVSDRLDALEQAAGVRYEQEDDA